MSTKSHKTLTGDQLHEPKGADTAPAGEVYVSDGLGSGTWTPVGSTIGLASFTTGDLKATWKTSPDSGWVMCNDGTIGDASSGASNRANADTSALYTLLWTNFSDSFAPVTGGRGASASADFSAHKKITLPLMAGRVPGVAGAGSGLTSRSLGFTVGEEGHSLTIAELAAHNHTTTPTVTDPGHQHVYSAFNGAGSGGGSTASGAFTSANTNSAVTGITVAVSVGNTGSSTAHNTMQPTSFVNMMVKL